MQVTAYTANMVVGLAYRETMGAKVEGLVERLVQERIFSDRCRIYEKTLAATRNCRDITLAGPFAAVFADGNLSLWNLDRDQLLWTVPSSDKGMIGCRETAIDETGVCLLHRPPDNVFEPYTYELFSNGERFDLAPGRLRCAPVCSWGSVLGVKRRPPNEDETHRTFYNYLIEWDRKGMEVRSQYLEFLNGCWKIDMRCSQQFIVVVGIDYRNNDTQARVVIVDRLLGTSTCIASSLRAGKATIGDIVISGRQLFIGHQVERPYSPNNDIMAMFEPRITVHNLVTGALEAEYPITEGHATVRSIRCNDEHIVCHAYTGSERDWIFRIDRRSGEVTGLITQDCNYARKVHLFVIGNCLNVINERGDYLADCPTNSWYDRTVIDLQSAEVRQRKRYPRSHWNTCSFTPEFKFVISERDRRVCVYGDDYTA